MKRIIVLLTLVALMMVMAVGPAFAQTTMGSGGFNDLSVVTFGGNCVVNDFVEICTVPLGGGL
jgi:hypothetical protein